MNGPSDDSVGNATDDVESKGCGADERWHPELEACVPADPYDGQELIIRRGNKVLVYYWNPWRGAAGEWEPLDAEVPEPADGSSEPVIAADIDSTGELDEVLGVIAEAAIAEDLASSHDADTPAAGPELTDETDEPDEPDEPDEQ